MKIALSTGSLFGYPLEAIFAIAREVGFDGVEVSAGRKVVSRGRAYLERLSARYDLPIVGLHPPVTPPWGQSQQEEEASFYSLIDLALELGTPVVTWHTPYATGFTDDRWVQFLAPLRRILRQVDGHSLQVALENTAFFGDKVFVLSGYAELRRFAETEGCFLTLDVCHGGTFGWDLIAAYEVCRSKVVNIHLSDLRPIPRFLDYRRLHPYLKHHQMPGRGRLPLAEFLNFVAADGYEGVLTLEPSPVALGAWWPGRARANLTKSLAFARKAIDASRGRQTVDENGDAP